MDSVVGINLDTARNIAIVVVVTAGVLAVLSAWLMKAIISKLAGTLVLGVIALLAWTQRTALDDCAADVRDRVTGDVVVDDTTCTFFGRDVAVGAGPELGDS